MTQTDPNTFLWDNICRLLGDAAQAHVIAVPSEYGEVMRCVVGTTASGAISTACAPKSIEVISTDP